MDYTKYDPFAIQEDFVNNNYEPMQLDPNLVKHMQDCADRGEMILLSHEIDGVQPLSGPTILNYTVTVRYRYSDDVNYDRAMKDV